MITTCIMHPSYPSNPYHFYYPTMTPTSDPPYEECPITLYTKQTVAAAHTNNNPDDGEAQLLRSFYSPKWLTVTSLHKMLPSTTSHTNQAGGAPQEQDRPHRIQSMLRKRLSTQDKHQVLQETEDSGHTVHQTHTVKLLENGGDCVMDETMRFEGEHEMKHHPNYTQ